MFFPNEIWVQIFSFLDKKRLGKMAQISKLFQNLAYDNSLWGSLIREKMPFGDTSFIFKPMLKLKLPKYVFKGYDENLRIRYIRILYWFYRKYLNPNCPFYLQLHSAIHIIRRKRMISCLEASGCVPKNDIPKRFQ